MLQAAELPPLPAAAQNAVAAQPKQAATPVERLATVASILLHPTLLPTYAIAGILYGKLLPVGTTDDVRWAIISLVFSATFGMPLAGVLAMRWAGMLQGSLEMPTRRERIAPMALTVAIYIVSSILLEPILPDTLLYLIYGAAGLAAITLAVTFFYRLSAHVLAAAGYAGFWLAIGYKSGNAGFLWPIVACVLLVGASAWARLTLKAHTAGEVLAGFAIGAAGGAALAFWGY